MNANGCHKPIVVHCARLLLMVMIIIMCALPEHKHGMALESTLADMKNNCIFSHHMWRLKVVELSFPVNEETYDLF